LAWFSQLPLYKATEGLGELREQKDKEVFVKTTIKISLIAFGLLLTSCATQTKSNPKENQDSKKPNEELVRAYYYGADVVGNRN
tara:strand:- start:64900 stop:65151 length:252 start_codon:yes stop_codon:yes gene_type:complete